MIFRKFRTKYPIFGLMGKIWHQFFHPIILMNEPKYQISSTYLLYFQSEQLSEENLDIDYDQIHCFKFICHQLLA